MSDALFSEHWYRVRSLRPKLVPDVEVIRHVYREQVQYVFYRKNNSSCYRIGQEAYQIAGQFDGYTTLEDIWKQALSDQGDRAPDQRDIVELISELNAADLVILDRKQKSEVLFQQHAEHARKDIKERFLNPLFLRFRLSDPDRLLSLFEPRLRKFLSLYPIWFALPLILFTLAAMAPHFTQFRQSLLEIISTKQHLLLLAIVIYPAMKLVHEFAHGILLKRYGGEVRELGIALMVFLPVPYIDASAANAIASKHKRMLISLAGVFAEISMAAIAALIWLNAEGVVQDVAMLVFIVGFISTLLINGNPLLKFDAYYVLADYLEIPNLYDKSREYLKHRVLKLLIANVPEYKDLADNREACWLVLYAVLSSLYRIGLLLSIAWMVSQKFFFLGGLLAIWIVYSNIVLPACRAVEFLLRNSGSAANAKPGTLLLVLLLLPIASAVLPLPHSNTVEGLVWLPEQSIVRVSERCQVTEQYREDGARVMRGDTLFSCENEELPFQIRDLMAQTSQLRSEQMALAHNARSARKVAQSRLDSAENRLRSMHERTEKEQIRAATDGVLFFPDNRILYGQHFDSADIVAYVIPYNDRSIKLAIPESQIYYVRSHLVKVSLLLPSTTSFHLEHSSKLSQLSPTATTAVVNEALTDAGGGELQTSNEGGELRYREPVFTAVVAWPDEAKPLAIGTRVQVRLIFKSKPIAGRVIAQLLRTFSSGKSV